MRARASLSWSVVFGAAFLLGAEPSGDHNGFRIEGSSVPPEKIIAGGPGRDGIRSVDEPRFTGPGEATWVAGDTPVLGVALGGEARAYPIHLLEHHQVVNDVIGDVPVVVAYGPLSGTPMAFRSTVDGRRLTFGVSGLLYNSNFLLYDRETESLWSQFVGEAIAGELVRKKLERLRVRQEPFGVWLERHRNTKVLARPEPKRIDYRYSPFSSYWVQDRAPFPVDAADTRFHAKELVVGVVANGKARAYLGSRVAAAGGRLRDEFQGRPILIVYASELGTFSWDAPDDVSVTEGYWFAWKAFHPDTEIWNAPPSTPKP